MVLLLASLQEIKLFLKIVLWIAVPLITISFLITTILHYRQKKRNALRGDTMPELEEGDGDKSIVSRLQREVSYYRKRIGELQHVLSFAKDEVPKAPLTDQPLPALDPENISIAGVIGETVSPANEAIGSDLSGDAAYLQDLVNEQKAHVQFLQTQLENRIRSFHEMEQQCRDARARVQRLEKSLQELQSQHNKTLQLLDKQAAL
ncbi:MAG: hypothetical protein EOO02_16185 [Chitinophagaceae bacterium]|nr:MAG: hypothetical protein EOO02_16185 [Chitinophagaceae bacterium]